MGLPYENEIIVIRMRKKKSEISLKVHVSNRDSIQNVKSLRKEKVEFNQEWRYHQQQNKWYLQRCLLAHFETIFYFSHSDFFCYT